MHNNGCAIEELNKKPTLVVFYCSHEISPVICDWQACTGDTVLAKSREMTGMTQTMLLWLGGGGVKTTEKNALAPMAAAHVLSRVPLKVPVFA